METGKPHFLFTLSIVSLLLFGSAALAVASGDFLNQNAAFSANANYKSSADSEANIKILSSLSRTAIPRVSRLLPDGTAGKLCILTK